MRLSDSSPSAMFLLRTSLRRALIGLFVGLLLAAPLEPVSGAEPAAKPADPAKVHDPLFASTIDPFLKQHCYACHGPEKQEAGVRYDRIGGFDRRELNLWTMVHERVSAGEMPPEDRPQPSDAEKKALFSWIEQQQRLADNGSTRRLNRREFAAALRDVTGLAIDYADAMPADGTVAGFDTGAEALQDAADSVDLWMRITRRGVGGVRFLDPPPGPVYTADLAGAVKDIRPITDQWKNDGATLKSRGVLRPGLGMLLEPKALGDRDSFDMQVPAPPQNQGIVRIAVVVSLLNQRPGVPTPRLWVEAPGKKVAFEEVTASPDAPQRLEYFVQLDDLSISPKGVSISLSNKVEVPYAVKGFENEDKSRPEQPVPGGTGLFRPAFDRKTLKPEEQPAPWIVLHSVEIEPNYVASWPPAEWNSDLKLSDARESAEQAIALFIDRAWRRPVKPEERKPFLALFEQLRKEHELSFDDALRAAFQSILMSGPFRYLPGPKHIDPVVAQHAIAARLSFMLVGAPPDAELRKLAEQKKLSDLKVIDAQVDRLLDDPRSADGFVRPFVMQWLEMEQPITIAMVNLQQQDFRFARYLKESMRNETLAYVAQMLAENLPARELIDSDWTMMNDSLAVQYGYSGIEGGQLRKTPLKKNDPRGGGILAHAGLQSMLTWMGENWVIYRGAWALRHIVDLPPPPPPLEVPELIPSDSANRGKNFRQLLLQHQEDSRCSICHKHMDPLGFAFQNFDLSGRWRDKEFEHYERSEIDGKIAWKGTGASRPVDARGNLPRGEEFKSWGEFKRILAEKYQTDLVRGMLKNLMLYATGRKPDVDDMQQIATILKEQEPRGYPLRDLVKAVVKSPSFLNR